MKILLLISALTISLGLSSCAGFFGSSSNQSEYQRGLAAGRAHEIRRQYWEKQSKPVETPQLEKRYTPITVPEHTSSDGVLIEAHTGYVKTVL